MDNRNNPQISKCLNGWTWGNIKHDKENVIEFETQGKEWFSIKSNHISNIFNPNKNEIGFEFIYENEDKDGG